MDSKLVYATLLFWGALGFTFFLPAYGAIDNSKTEDSTTISVSHQVDYSTCGFGACFNFVPAQNISPPISNPNWSMDVFMPNGMCNLFGIILSNGSCSTPSIILSDGNFTNLKGNPGIMSVNNIHTTNNNINTNYCPLAMYVLTNQDGYFSKIQPYQKLVYPDYCINETGPNPFPVPEFPITIGIISSIAILGTIIIVARSELKK